MKVLITGATGFIGSHLVDTLLARGVTVWVLARPNKPTDNLEVWAAWGGKRTGCIKVV